MSIFEQAARQKLRFPSDVGDLTVENLWDQSMPLTSRTGKVCLDALAREVHTELKSMEEVSFVETKPDPRKSELELKLEILKHIIAAKIAERDSAKLAAENLERKRRLTSILADKQDEKLKGMTEEEIRAEIAKL